MTLYNKEFISKINKSIQNYKNGNFTTVEKDELESFLGLTNGKKI